MDELVGNSILIESPAFNMRSTSSPPQSQTKPTIAMKEKQEEEEEDRISQLPDDILDHILCFLPSKAAAKTTVLSSRWKHLFWSTVARLNINMHKESTKHNVEPAIRLFEALFNCKTLISADITTNFFHLPEIICVPKLQFLHLEVEANIGSLMKGFNRIVEMQRHGCPTFEGFIPILSANNHLVLCNTKTPRGEYFLEIETVGSLGELGCAAKKRKEAAYVYADRNYNMVAYSG